MERENPPDAVDNDPADPDEAGASVVTRVGTAAFAGVVSALVASVPAMLRMGGSGSVLRAFEHWAALGALATPIAVLGVGVLRRARVGVRLLFGSHLTAAAAMIVWWCVLELGILSAFGALLRAKTHHHGLAGVTFAFFALASGVVVGLLAIRGGRLLARLGASAQRAVLGLAVLAALAALVLVGVRTSRSPDLATAAVLVDVAALAVACAAGSSAQLARARVLALLGVPLAAVVLVLGLSLVRGDAALADGVAARAPVHAWLLSLLAAR